MRGLRIPALVWWSLAGLAAVAVLAAVFWWLNLGSQARLEVNWLKVRTIATGPESSMAVFDLRIHNPSRVLFQVNEVEIEVVTANGERAGGLVVAQTDLDRALSYYPLAGPRYSAVLMFKERIPGGDTRDRTVAASFAVPEAALASRQGFAVRIQDADGAVVAAAEPARRAR